MKRFNRGKFFSALGVMLLGALPLGAALAATDDQLADEQAYLNLLYENEQLVEVATRSPKPISQIAENVTIVTAEEIAAMNAHTVAEVLNRVSGVFIKFYRQDFAFPVQKSLHGSDYEHVLVLMDGMRWNQVNSDFPTTNTIPVRIIKRIEIIKGAASSTWGSALGGVINIITKEPGTSASPAISASASYGEQNSLDYGGEISGAAGRLGYYLSAGGQDSDGLLDDKSFDHEDFFGKVRFDLSATQQLLFSMGQSRMEAGYLFWPPWDTDDTIDNRAFFYTVSYNGQLTGDLSLNISAYDYEGETTDNWIFISSGLHENKYTNEGRTRGFSSRVVFNHGGHTAVVGAEYVDRTDTGIDELTQTTSPTNEENIWSLYVNDTYKLGRLTLTPGLRYDHFSIAKEIISPSLGATYRVTDTTLLRAAVGHGFRKPTIGLKQLNSLLEHETIWSYQVGVETSAARYLRLKTTAFIDQSEDYWYNNWGVWENGSDYKRYGLEAEVQTVSWHDISLSANGTYIRLEPGSSDSANLSNANIILAYDNPAVVQARLMGHANWWGDIFSPDDYNGQFGSFVWDLTANKTIYSAVSKKAELFFTIHNLGNASDYYSDMTPNEGRWVEGGIKLHMF